MDHRRRAEHLKLTSGAEHDSCLQQGGASSAAEIRARYSELVPLKAVVLRRGEIAVRGAAHGRCPDLRCRVGARPGGARPGRFTRVEVPRLPPLAYDHPERGAAIPLRAGKQLSRSVASRAIRRANEEWFLGLRSRVLGCTHSELLTR